MLTGKEFAAALPEDRQALLRDRVLDHEEPGLLAYLDGVPVGWCAVGPRDRYTRMMSPRSRVFGPVDDHGGNWVVNCFFVRKSERGRGIATALLAGAVDHARTKGASSLDGYPLLDPTKGAAALYVGSVSMFEEAGFKQIRLMGERPLMRLVF
jgi:GNAT superfamily N-acetyltransferase